MSRWEPDARGRLLRAAIDLFAEQGYDATTTAQIAARAGLTKTTFFRNFADKREVLFFGQEVLVGLAAAGTASAPADASAIEAAAAGAVAMASAHTDEQRDYAPRITAVVASHDELRERAAFKHASIQRALAEALAARGVAEPVRGLAAELATRAYYLAFARWTAQGEARPMPQLVQEAVEELRAAAAALV